FNETGLPQGTNWSVEVNAARLFSDGSPSIRVTLLASITPVNITPVPGFVPSFYHQSVDPTGPDQSLNISWHPFLLNTSFEEIGLPSGKAWAVDFAGTVNRTSGTVLDFEAPNGTYAFSVTAPVGYQANVTAGTIQLQNRSQNRSVAFSPILYDLTFEEAGLPSGQAWSVEVGGSNETSTSATASFQVPNGTLSYKILPISGFHASPYSGNLDVAGLAIVVS
ncbi:thermopsin precursor related protein, partial [mine drainage metagenome]